ncbi:DUF924 domain-containing protein [Patescibacteria group bacterium]|nr:DUF924 domain-containing protein [Patescibacteria group bacterium]MBU1500689.1 DUF924 domain-containing protein [Patescibacteria group bacterium]MBU2080758.1 DUF924 domain-containing protein [Patescibacteria group bacterium]MBU2123863.1 DUF924 domain-containing protein [Patescibacteria group bacterium]MBU2194846.1 DUF924 domain-containing protein [Patescibacteria group bacterium]
MNWNEVITFWFETLSPSQWFIKDPALDEEIRNRFLSTYLKVVKGETAEWREVPEGRLAEIIVLDQFARNMFRDTPQAFEYDPLALQLAEEAIKVGADRRLTRVERKFLYMPYMHSESPVMHKKAFWLFLFLGDFSTLSFELKHKKIIDRFGRYPHRNDILGRTSTPKEIEFMKSNKGF